jgi:hypothetical protein
MSPQLPTHLFHPELGYLCPSRQLRQNVRVGLAAAAFGLITGLGAALVLLPRHSDNIAWTEPALAAAPAEPASHSVSGSGPSSLAATSDTAKKVPADGIVKQRPERATISLGIGAANEAHPHVEIPARAAPLVTSDRTAAVRGTEQGRPVSSKRVKTAGSYARRRAREAAPPDPFANRPANRPVGFQLSPFAYDTRSGQRRDWGSGWSW